MFSTKTATLYLGYREIQTLELLAGGTVWTSRMVADALGLAPSYGFLVLRKLSGKGYVKCVGWTTPESVGRPAGLYRLTASGKKLAAKTELLFALFPADFGEGNCAGKILVNLTQTRKNAELVGKQKSTWKTE